MNKNKLNSILSDSSRTFSVKRDNSNELVNKDFIKSLRSKLDFTQVVFSSVLGVSVKTVEKWEQGSVEPRSIVKKFLYLVDKKPELINEFYSFESHKVKPVQNEFVMKVGLNDIFDMSAILRPANDYENKDYSDFKSFVQNVTTDQQEKNCCPAS